MGTKLHPRRDRSKPAFDRPTNGAPARPEDSGARLRALVGRPGQPPDAANHEKVRGILLPGSLGGRWIPLLLPGGVRPRFCLSNLKALASQLGSNCKSLIIVGTCVNEPSRWSPADRQPGLYCTRRSCFAPISNGAFRMAASPLVVEAPGYCPPGPKCLFHQILYRHSRLPGPAKIGGRPPNHKFWARS